MLQEENDIINESVWKVSCCLTDKMYNYFFPWNMQRHAGGMNLLINYWLPHPFGIGRILHARGVLFHLSCSFLADRSASWLSCLFCDSSFSTCFKASSRCCWSRSTCACKFLISSCILLMLPFPFLAPGLYLPLFRFWSLLLPLPAIRRDKCLGVTINQTHWLIITQGRADWTEQLNVD